MLFPETNDSIVEPKDYTAWEELVFSLVKHYRDRGAGIRYWEVGNEVDIGESGGTPYRFQPESYVRYYRHTTAAILRADPEARVGGPALASVQSPIFPALLDACATKKTPLHFVSWHLYNSSPAAIRGTIDYAYGLLKRHPDLQPETFLDEWNMDLFNPPLDPRFQPCYVAETVWQMKDAGLDWSCYYHLRDYYVSYDTFSKLLLCRRHCVHDAMVEPTAAVRRALRLPEPDPPRLFHLQAALAHGRRAPARQLHQRQGPRFRHARPAVADAQRDDLELLRRAGAGRN